jgi:uncharacterized membrane-anchored protein YitT (DUF2179 family)
MSHNINESTANALQSLLTLSNLIQLLLGVILVVFALKGFMIPNHFLDGGIIGISLLLYEIYGINLSLCLIIGNIGFLILAYKKISKALAIKSLVAIILLVIGLELVHIQAVTTDHILTAIFGGAILGIGIGLIIRTGAAIDGSEILVVLTRQKIGLSMSEVIILMNTILFLIIALKLGIETAMFSIITYFTAAKMIDYVVDGVEQFTALTIISGQSEKIKNIIVVDFGKGITVYKGERGYLPGMIDIKNDCDIIVTIVTRLELLNIKKAIKDADPNAFLYVNTVKEASGGILKKLNAH